MLIHEVSKKYDISSDTLRYYEKIGLLEPVSKTSGGIRDYKSSDLERIEFIKCMRSAGLSIEVLKKYIDLFKLGDSTIEDRRNLLINQREILLSKINDMNKALDKLNYKIDIYYKEKLYERISIKK